MDEDVAWVLIVEKEAVFQTLCRLGITDGRSLPGRGLLLTGKGYPDVATRHLVKSLADALPRTIPIMALVDGDPYGLDILSVYKYGSLSMQHESGKLATKRIKWLGIWASELETSDACVDLSFAFLLMFGVALVWVLTGIISFQSANTMKRRRYPCSCDRPLNCLRNGSPYDWKKNVSLSSLLMNL